MNNQQQIKHELSSEIQIKMFFLQTLKQLYSIRYFMALMPYLNQIIQLCVNQIFRGMYSGDQNSVSYDQSSSEEKKYFCYCEKVFATYSGLYQHIKSKHPNLFPAYKKMKLQKMLKKSRDSRGTYNYKLIKIELDIVNLGSSAEKIKRNTQSSQSRMKKKVINMPQKEQIKAKQRKIVETSYKEKQQNIDPRFHKNQIFTKKPEAQQDTSKQFLDPYMNFSTEMPPYPPHFPHFIPQMFSHYPPYYPQFRLTIKGFLVKFLCQSPDFNKEQTKAYLYKLMIFIDKNVHLTNDPRVKAKLFLSYCDEFDPLYLGALLSQFIEKLESSFKENITQYNEEQVNNKKLQIDCIKAFAEWLSNAGLLQLEKKERNEIKVVEVYQSHLQKQETDK